MKQKVYIAGKVTGIEEKAAEMFNEAQDSLERLGFEVVNPMKLSHSHDKTWLSYMKECFRAMTYCNSIYFLPNWKKSEGATDEALFAAQLQLKFLNLPNEQAKVAYKHAKKTYFKNLTTEPKWLTIEEESERGIVIVSGAQGAQAAALAHTISRAHKSVEVPSFNGYTIYIRNIEKALKLEQPPKAILTLTIPEPLEEVSPIILKESPKTIFNKLNRKRHF